MKIYEVTFNNGGWHSGSLPSFHSAANSKEEAIENILKTHTYYRTGYDSWATEFKIEGYVIEIYDEKTYNREKSLEKLI